MLVPVDAFGSRMMQQIRLPVTSFSLRMPSICECLMEVAMEDGIPRFLRGTVGVCSFGI